MHILGCLQWHSLDPIVCRASRNSFFWKSLVVVLSLCLSPELGGLVVALSLCLSPELVW